MGYYVSTIDNDFFLDKDHFDDVYKKMCELNDYNDLKRGGSYGSNQDIDTTDRYPKNRWFSWMEYNYPEIYKDLFGILQSLGFEYSLDEQGNMNGISYPYNKTGNEEYFLCCFAGFVKDGSYLEFEGEDYSHWKYVFKNGKMIRYDGETIIKYEDAEVYEFGKPTQADIQHEIWRKEFHAKMEAEKALEQ